MSLYFIRGNASIDHERQGDDLFSVVGVHRLPNRVEGVRQPNDLLALGVTILLDVVNLLVWSSLHEETEHLLHFVQLLAIPYFVDFVHADSVDTINKLQH